MSAYNHQSRGRIRPFAWVFNLVFFILMSITSLSLADEISGFSHEPTPRFTKVERSGELTTQDAQEWACVKDEQTGLMWQKRDPSSGLHGLDTYTWYQPEHVNPGEPRAHYDSSWADTTCHGFNANDPMSYCNTSAYADRVNQSNYCGYSDWRLPTASELQTLNTPDRKEKNLRPLLDTRYFPFHDPFLFWTRSANDSGVIITIFGDSKLLENSEWSDTASIRLVRGPVN